MRAIGLPKILAFYALVAGLAAAALWRQPNASLLQITPWGLLLGSAAGLGLVALSRLLSVHTRWGAQLADEFRVLVGPLSAPEALSLALASGIAEEALFRGVLQPSLGLLITSGIFAALHVGPNPRFIPWTVITFFAGLLFGALLLWTQSLWPPILAHATVNFFNLRYLSNIKIP